MTTPYIDPDSPTAWMAEGRCRLYPADMFFPSDGVGVIRAKKVCASCPVTEQCLEHAVENRIDHGVWGGASERQRRKIAKQRKAAAEHTTAVKVSPPR